MSVDVPTLILSGFFDPVTPSRWGKKANGNLPNSLHIIAPGAHGVGGAYLRRIERQFLESGFL